ncbi:hypothetical protein BASA81_011326 [Batrachochytrium salamandrivorans]|nr:hypothetical protein BASA81_011326 [Batrachochytrium salamandrivorans]
MEEEMEACLRAGGGVVVAKIKSRRDRKCCKRILAGMGAKESELGIWKLAGEQRQLEQFGAQLPPSRGHQQEEEEEEDYGPTLVPSAKRVQLGVAAPSPTARGEWMSAALPTTDSKLLLHHQAQHSQKSRTFTNHKSTSATSSGAGPVDSRETATGKAPSPLSGDNNNNAGPFRWDHGEMMGSGNDVDKARIRNELDKASRRGLRRAHDTYSLIPEWTTSSANTLLRQKNSTQPITSAALVLCMSGLYRSLFRSKLLRNKNNLAA